VCERESGEREREDDKEGRERGRWERKGEKEKEREEESQRGTVFITKLLAITHSFDNANKIFIQHTRIHFFIQYSRQSLGFSIVLSVI
jgi:hypothetical protein